jgi:subtilisin family serine protease
LSPAQAEEDSLAGLFSGEPTETKRFIVVLKMSDIESKAKSGTRSKRAATRARIDAVKSVQDKFLSKFSCSGDEISCPMSGAKVKTKFKYTPAVVAEVNEAAAKAIGKMDMVAFVEEDVPVPPILSESTPLIGADTVWAQGYSGTGQTVAVLDTGVDKTHPDLAGKVVAEACYSTISAAYNATTVCPNGLDEQQGDGAGVDCDSSVHGCSHGTHVAGIVAANGSVKGVAKDAEIIAIQVFSRFDNATYCRSSTPCALSFTSDQIAGLERVLELHEGGTKIAAVNMSLGGGKYSEACNGAIQGPIDNLRAVGIATIVASGNEYHPNGIASPACISSAISVGATTKSDAVADYSNSAYILDLLAPGSYIESTIPDGTGTKSGTSMATPHVAGAFAVLKAAAPDANVADILSVLKRTGKRIEDNRSGIIKPRINLEKAIKLLAPPPAMPDISVAPTSHDFGDVTVGKSSTVKTLTVSNTGDGDLEIGQLALTGGDFLISIDNCSKKTVVAGGNCTVKVTFKPQTEGAKKATLSIPSNDPDTATAMVALSGKGIAVVVPIPDISVTPMSHDFGDVKVNESSSVTVTISNTGDGDLAIGQLALTGGDFIISSDNCSNTTVAAGGNCTVKVTFNPQSEGAKKATLSIPSNDPDTATAMVALSGDGVADVVTPTPAPASPCLLYAVHDQGLNNSQLFTIGLDAVHEVNPLGPMYVGYDLESIAIHPASHIIYVASGDDVATGLKKGAIYTVDSTTGDLALVCNTGFNEIEDLAFSANGEILWAWAKGDGLIRIDLTSIDSTTGEPICESNLEIPSKALVEGLTLKENDGTTTFYGTVNTALELWEYNPNTGNLNVCTNLPGESEALEMMQDGILLFGTHNDSSFSLHAFDPSTCLAIVAEDIPTGRYNDVEGIALPTEECAK